VRLEQRLAVLGQAVRDGFGGDGVGALAAGVDDSVRLAPGVVEAVSIAQPSSSAAARRPAPTSARALIAGLG